MSDVRHGLSEDELAALPAAEREALEADYSEDEKRLAAGAPGIEHVDPNAAKKAEEPEPDAAATAAAAAKPAVAAPVAAAPAGAAAEPAKVEGEAEGETDEDEARRPITAPFQAPAVDEAKVKAELDAIDKKFEDGELTQRERDDQRDAINRAVLKAELAAESEEQTRKNAWDNEIDRFMEDNKAYKTDRVLYSALNAEVKRIAGDEANAKLSDRKVLALAHAEVAKRLKVEPAASAEDAAKALREKRKPDLSKVPPTLAHVPAAAPQNNETDEFASVDALTAKAAGGDEQAAMALEQAVARMTKEQQDRWGRATA